MHYVPHHQSHTGPAYPTGHSPPRAAAPTAASAHARHQQSMTFGHTPLERTVPISRCATQLPYFRAATTLPLVPYDIPPEIAEPTIKKKRKRADTCQLEALARTYSRTELTPTEERLQLAKDLDMLQCTGSFPSPRASHAVVFVNDVMYVSCELSKGESCPGDLYAPQLSCRCFSMLNRYLVHMRNAVQRWFEFHNLGPSPAMASDATRVFVLGGYSNGPRAGQISFIHVFDTSMYDRFCQNFWTA